MKTMKDQATSIEQSKRLIELGVPADKASLVYRKRYIKRDYVLDVEDREMEVIAPAFTVADLLEKVLPNVIQDAHNTYELTLKAVVGGGWRFCYTPVLTPLEADNIGDEMGDNLIELLCNRIEWIVSNGYGLNL